MSCYKRNCGRQVLYLCNCESHSFSCKRHLDSHTRKCNTNPVILNKALGWEMKEKSKKNLHSACQRILDKITEIYNTQIELLDSPEFKLNQEVIIDDSQINTLLEQVSSLFSIKPKEPINHSKSALEEMNQIDDQQDDSIEEVPNPTGLRRSSTVIIKQEDISYEGTFEEGKYLTGFATAKTAKGDIYIGNIVNGQFEGNGTIIFSTGQKYEGEWREGKRHGKGKNFWPNGNVYDGEFVNGIIQGIGKFTYKNGDFYEGVFDKSRRHGYGKYCYCDGDAEEGNWVEGKLEGSVIRTVKGQSRSAEYKDGKFKKYN